MYRLKILRHGSEIRELELESGREYTFGRGSDCDVQLEEQTGISRTHFRLIEDGGQWSAQVVSKFGDIQHAGLPVQQLALEPGAVFKLGAYDFHFLDAKQEAAPQPSATLPATIDANDNLFQHQGPIAVGGGAMSYPPPVSETPHEDPGFDGNDEATRVIAHEAEVPFIRMVEPNGREENVKLEGRRWIAGREDGSNILLNDRKASRRQFELTSTPQGYFIRDLGSSNGTLLNGMQLAHDELKAIRSGDVIQVGKVLLHFEIRDPHFENKLMVVPTQVRSDFPIVVQSPYEMINYPVASGPGGAVRVDGQSGGLMAKIDSLPIPFTENLDAEKKKKVRFWIIAAIILIPMTLVFMLGGNDKPKKPAAKTNIAFDKLTPKQQQQVKEIYALALNLYMQQKLALAADQLAKLHEIIKDGYENSLAMAQECAQQADMERQLRDLEEQKRRQEEIRRTVEKTIRDCDALSKRSTSMEEITRCLRPAMELDPENSLVREAINRVQARIDRERMERMDRDRYRKEVARGKSLYDKAQALELEGEYQDALAAYRVHANSHFPDPDGLRAISQRQILSITKKIDSKVEDFLHAAEAAYGVGNYREALEDVAKAKKINPKHERAAELNGKYRRELNTKLREIYEEAVISEGLGQIDEAKGRWKKILETDTADGEYYKKAKHKMRAYGTF